MYDRFRAYKDRHQDAPWGFIVAMLFLEEATPLIRALVRRVERKTLWQLFVEDAAIPVPGPAIRRTDAPGPGYPP